VTDLPSLVVSEIFGPTVSGEGASLGRRCGFIRLMGCNLHCTWCDTAYTWDSGRFDLHAEGTRMTWAEIVDRIVSMNVGRVIISGGEPLLHQGQPAWELVLRALDGAAISVEVETNGTVLPTMVSEQWVEHFTVSPKLEHAGDPADSRVRPEVIGVFKALNTGYLGERVIFKFVCGTPEHVAEVQRWAKTMDVHSDHIWVMPLGANRTEISRSLAKITDAAITAGFNVTTRLHIQVWGNARGH
jgi:organic radical activating enzyme